jgi:serine protease AprX
MTRDANEVKTRKTVPVATGRARSANGPVRFLAIAAVLSAVAGGQPPPRGAAGDPPAVLSPDSSRPSSIDTGLPGQFGVPSEAEPAQDPETAAANRPHGLMSVFVHMDPLLPREAAQRAALRDYARRGQRRRNPDDRRLRSVIKYEYRAVLPNVLNLRNLTLREVEDIRSMPGVTGVEPDVFHDNLLQLQDSVPLIHGLQSQIAESGFSATGRGVRVCIVDTGIAAGHVLFAGRIDTAAGYDFHNDDADPLDDNGHGTHVAGIAAGGVGFGVEFPDCSVRPVQGIAPDATIIAVKVVNSVGGGAESNIIAGIDYCADQSPEGGRADIINLSIGTGQFSGPCLHSLARAANDAAAQGVVVVVAAGNSGFDDALTSPACGEQVMAVGATYDSDFPNCLNDQARFTWCLDLLCLAACTDDPVNADGRTCFSNRSAMLDVVAPGCDIWSASIAADGNSITNLSGTSQAAPHVTGLAALILELDPALSPADVRRIIREGAIDLGEPGFDNSYGYGRIDVVRSLRLVARRVR